MIYLPILGKARRNVTSVNQNHIRKLSQAAQSATLQGALKLNFNYFHNSSFYLSEPVHCIVWAKHLFNQLFGEADPDEDVSPDTEDPEASGEDAGKKV